MTGAGADTMTGTGSGTGAGAGAVKAGVVAGGTAGEASASAGPGRRNWRAAARCRIADADELFVRGSAQREARGFCRTCPVRTECLAHALDERVEHGVWGGMTERERRALLRNRPDVTSWTDLLFAARAAHTTTVAARRAGRRSACDRAPGCATTPRPDADRAATTGGVEESGPMRSPTAPGTATRAPSTS